MSSLLENQGESMASSKTYTVKFRRRREGKTNYLKRLALLKSAKARFVVRKSNNRILVQVIAFDSKGDTVIASATSHELQGFGWKVPHANVPCAYLTGLLAGMKAKEKVKEAILDIGMASPVHGSAFFAAAKGCVDAGIALPLDESAVPKADRMNGKHIQEYAASLDSEKFQKLFSLYLAKDFDPRHMVQAFEEAKKKILQARVVS